MNRREALENTFAGVTGLTIKELPKTEDTLMIVVTSEMPLTENQMKLIRDTVRYEIGDVPVLICDKGMDIKLVRRSDVENAS